MTVNSKAIKYVVKKLKPLLLPLSSDRIIFNLMVAAYKAGHREGALKGRF